LKHLRNFVLSAAVFVPSLGVSGKLEKIADPAEQTGVNMAWAFEQKGDKAGQAMEKVGDVLQEAGDRAKEMPKDTVDKVIDTKT
jgi:hypothetical protein